MTIRHRMIFLAALTFAAISIIGGFSVFQSQRSASKVKSVTEVVVPSGFASADLVFQLKEVQIETLVVISSPNLRLAELARNKLQVKMNRLKEAMSNQAVGASGKVQVGLLAQASESMDNYFLMVDRAVNSRMEGRLDEAQTVFFGTVVQYQTELEQIVDTLRQEKRRVMQDAIVNLNDSMLSTVLAVAAATIAAIAFWGFMGVLLYRRITHPISCMQNMMSEIAASQDFTRRVPVDSMDEIGQSIAAFNGMIEKIEASSEQLKQKTADIQSMLQNIPQGILMLVENNRIHPAISAHLETIFETKHIAGHSLMDVVFSRTNLRPDRLRQLESLMKSCIGQDMQFFAHNQPHMVDRIEKKMTDGRVKILDLIWSPIVDDHGKIVRLMLSLRDVTELHSLRQQQTVSVENTTALVA